ncbi:DUF6454 family protein [Nocardioides sp. LS1]|uniref:DUF6454 family protein n=1 Tax=Nocardioides sp. LS1 TaxID=1027620 RepID=UPI000F61927B|nr:DUF6454 family protein [Nocardioides sp. LS1]GCD89767.1 hypothetical protein NLS1_17730 [Nocardioides sp. LS1]
MSRIPLRLVTATAALGLAVGGALMATGADGASAPGATGTDGALATGFAKVTRNTPWTEVGKLHLDFNTFHTEGLAITDKHIFLSSVEIIEPTQKYPSPVGGYDRTPGKGVGHLFVMDRQGHLQKDIVLGEGDMYHPGGIDFDGHNVWVPVAEYRPDSASIIYKVDATTLRVSEQFRVQDHIGGIVKDDTTGDLVGNTWGSRKFYAWSPTGQQESTWSNPSHFIDYQDCQYVASAKAICSGVANLPQTPTAGGSAATYELGGLALVDLHTHAVLHEIPFQQWSEAGHVMTRNPVKMAADGSHLTLWAAPDNGEEAGGTELYTFTADVS